MKYYLLLSLSVFLFFGYSCKKNELEDPTDHSAEYFPMEVGYSWTYQMDSMVLYGTGAQTDSFWFLTKHTIVEERIENGNPFFVFELTYKADSNAPWKYVRSYSISTSENHVIKTDFDIQEIALSLPVLTNNSWDGNLFNNQPDALFYISEADAPANLNGVNYDSTCTVIQEEQVNLVNSFKGEERYARHTGLIYKHKERLTNLINPDQIDGYTYSMTLISFDK